MKNVSTANALFPSRQSLHYYNTIPCQLRLGPVSTMATLLLLLPKCRGQHGTTLNSRQAPSPPPLLPKLPLLPPKLLLPLPNAVAAVIIVLF